MQRHPDLYPNDDNGDTLWHIAQQGVDLSKPREIAFSVVFPTKESALEFSVMLLRFEQRCVAATIRKTPRFRWT